MPTEPQVVWMPGGVRTEIHLTGADTGGAFCLLVDHPPPGWSLPPHIHKDAAETIHVVAGEFEMVVDGATERLGPGQTVHIPAGAVHSGANVGTTAGRRLLTFAPAGMEEFFREAGAPSADAEVDREATRDSALRHGWRFMDADRPLPAERGRPAAPDGSIQTVSGRWLDPLDPDVACIDIGDIAQALANQCRFGGHARRFYSVAQHSAIVSDVCRERGASADEALVALLHDAGEAYLVDLPHPLKHRSDLGPPFRRAEQRVEEAIRARFELGPPPAGMKAIDRSLLATERATFASTLDSWPELEGFEPLPIEIEPWDPRRARREFLTRFERLAAARRQATTS